MATKKKKTHKKPPHTLELRMVLRVNLYSTHNLELRNFLIGNKIKIKALAHVHIQLKCLALNCSLSFQNIAILI